MPPTITSDEIIPMINYAWQHSFAKVSSNKDAIAERGFNPYNCALLLNKEIRATMTKEQRTNEKIVIPIQLKENYIEIDDDSPTFEMKYLKKEEKIDPSLNLSQGFGFECIKQIISSNDLNEAREKIKKEKEIGQSVEERIKEIKNMSAGTLFLAGSVKIGQSVYDNVNATIDLKKRKK